MRQIVSLFLPLLAVLPQPAMAQSIAYDFVFEASAPAPAEQVASEEQIDDQVADDRATADQGADAQIVYSGTAEPQVEQAQEQAQGSERFVETAKPAPSPQGAAYGPFRVVDASHAAMVGVTGDDAVEAFETMLRDHPGIATIEMVDCPGTENDRANLRLGRLIRDRGIATHVPANGFVGSGAVELYLAGVRRSAEPGAEFAVHSWEDDTGRQPADYAPDAPQNAAYLDYYRAMGMSDGEARSFYAMTNSVPFTSAKWLSAGEMDRWARLADPKAPAVAAQPFVRTAALSMPAAAKPRGASYGPFRVIDDTRAAMVGVTDAGTPAAFSAMVRDYPGIATLEMVDCPGTEDDRANLRLGRLIRAQGVATHVPANGWVASGAVELFLAGTRRSAEPSARFAVHSWEDDTGRGPQDYSPDAPKNRAYLDYYRTMGMSDGEARSFYAMTNSVPFSRPRSLTTADIARWTRLAPSPRSTLAQAVPLRIGG